MLIELRDIRKIAKQFGWIEEEAKDPTVLIFNRMKGKTHQQINVWFTKMTVGTSLNHPTKGKTQLFRRHVGKGELKEIFDNPRVHTNKGYYRRD